MQGRRPRWPVAARAASLVLVGCVAALAAGGDQGTTPGAAMATAATTQEFSAVADAYVRSDRASTRYGTLSELWADSSPTTRSYLRFQVSGVSGTVSRALLRVRANANHSAGFQVRRVTNTTWSETSINYSNAPSVQSTVTATSGALTGGVWTAVDITPLITGNGTYSLALTSTSSTNLVLSSRETGANGPRLSVESADTTPPQTTIGSGPSGTVASSSASFAFSSSETGSTFECSLDSAAYSGCSSPKDYTGLAAGTHTFSVRATDAAGNVDATPANRGWTVEPADGSAPDTAIDAGPSGTYRSGSADFRFSATEPGATFECRLDGAAFAACDPAPTVHVANGRHQLEVRARDAAGNPDPTPASRSWWADALLQNGNFETPLAGWTDQGGGYVVPAWKQNSGTLSLVSGGIAGPKAARLTATASGSLSMYASPWPINSARAGVTYTVQGSVRSETPGKDVCIRLREWDGSSVVGSAQTCATTTGSWRQFPVLQYVTVRDGTELDLLVYQSGTASAGNSFDLDGLSLGDGSSPAVPPTPAESGDPVLLAAGDVASCWSSGDESVSRLLDTLPGTIAIPGDTEQNHGYPAEYEGCYDPSWGRHKARTRPAVGDHEYGTVGAAGHFGYFGAAAGAPGKGWYSYDLGAWHIVVLNSNCSEVGGCGPGSEQYGWLQQDLQAHAGNCLGAYWHHPRFSAGGVHGNLPYSQPFWDLLYQYRAEWVFGGNDHNYQRFAPQTPTGELDRDRGIRQFVVGVGGTQHYELGPALPNTEVQNTGTFGVLKLTLHGDSYEWGFVPQEGKTFSDSGSTACSPLAGSVEPPPDTTIDSGPSGSVQSTAASFGFSASKPGASFECSLDGVAFAGCSSPKDYSGLAVGDHTFRVRAVDAAGTDQSPATRTWTIAAQPPPNPQPNLIANGGFEDSVSGWYAYKAGLSLVTGGAEGLRAGRVSLNTTATSFSLLSDPHPAGSHAAGTRYEARAWVRSQKPGKTTCLRLREWRAGSAVGSVETCRVATSSWERFDVLPYTALGGDSIELYAYQSSAATGDSFDIDGVTLTAGP